MVSYKTDYRRAVVSTGDYLNTGVAVDNCA